MWPYVISLAQLLLTNIPIVTADDDIDISLDDYEEEEQFLEMDSSQLLDSSQIKVVKAKWSAEEVRT